MRGREDEDLHFSLRGTNFYNTVTYLVSFESEGAKSNYEEEKL